MAHDDDETTSKRDREELDEDDELFVPRGARAPSGPPERPTLPAKGFAKARGKRADDDGLIDDGPTVFDPQVPTGDEELPEHVPVPSPAFESARIDDNLRTLQRPAPPPDPLLDEVPTGATVVGKRTPNPAAPAGPQKTPGAGLQKPGSGPQRAPGSGPRVAPVPPLSPDELPRPQAPTAGFDPHRRIDDLTRTAQWKGNAPPGPDPFATPPQPQPSPHALPLKPGPASAAIQVVSMKTPQEIAAEKAERKLPQVQIRAIADVRQATPPQGMGFLAPPHDPKQARSRRWTEYVLWGSVAVMVAAVVMLAVWFVAR